MESTKIKTMTSPTPTDWTGLGVIWAIAGGIVAIAFKWIDAYFKNKKTEKESFIKSVVETVMTSSLKDVNDKISTLFEYRERDRENLDKKFEGMMKELKK